VATGAPSLQRQAVPVRHRPNVVEMTAAQIAELRAAFEAMMARRRDDDRGYVHFASQHGLPLPYECGIAHGKPAFLPWHRAYLLRFEQALRDTGYDVMLPWWDWTRTRKIPPAFAEAQKPNGSANPLYSAPISRRALVEGARSGDEETARLAELPRTEREPGRPGTRLPTREEIEALMKHRSYEDFRSDLEDYHGNGHIWVGGHMGNLPFAAFDPIFWAHHCMIDRLWRIWQLRHPQASFPRRVRAQVMTPFSLTAADVLDPTALGYDYSLSIAQVRP
jgi:tyrosinase